MRFSKVIATFLEVVKIIVRFEVDASGRNRKRHPELNAKRLEILRIALAQYSVTCTLLVEYKS